jgi:hypothetical protein
MSGDGCLSSDLQYTESMTVNFTQHALARMNERSISREEVIETLARPLNTVPALGARKEAQGWIERSSVRMLLRVIYEGDTVLTVITVMATSKFAKYGVNGESNYEN